MRELTTIGVIAPASQVPKIELALGVQALLKAGFQVKVHQQCFESHLFFAGTDQNRAQAFLEYAYDPQISILWCARGGYGSVRLLPFLESATRTRGRPPHKLLIGYSDITALFAFVLPRWKWSILHGPMPSLRTFSQLPRHQWKVFVPWVQGIPRPCSWLGRKLKIIHRTHSMSGVAPLIGGNLTVLSSLLGTRFQWKIKDCFLFLEDVNENLYRIDRYLQQWKHSGHLNQVRGIFLGNFLNCRDEPAQVLSRRYPIDRSLLYQPTQKQLQQLRKPLVAQKTLEHLFYDLGESLQVPVLAGLPVGHGPSLAPLPLGANYCLDQQGRFSLQDWNWFKKPCSDGSI